jgi:hypothetical protein
MRLHGTPSKATNTNKTRPAWSFSSSWPGGPPCRPGVLYDVYLFSGCGAGIMFTLLPLFDLVYCVPGATFTAPFSSLGQTPEGAQQIFLLRRVTKILFKIQDLFFFQGKNTREDMLKINSID